MNKDLSKNDPRVVYASKQLNKYKKVKFLKTHNLITGETSATPEHIEVSKNYLMYLNIYLLYVYVYIY